MGRKILDVGTFGGSFHDVPDGFWCDSGAPDLIESTYTAEDCAVPYASRHHPLIDGAFRPDGDPGPDVLFLCQSSQQ